MKLAKIRIMKITAIFLFIPCLAFASLNYISIKGSNYVVDYDASTGHGAFIDRLICSTDAVLSDSSELARFEVSASSDLGYVGKFFRDDQVTEVIGTPSLGSYASIDGSIHDYDSYSDALLQTSTDYMGSAQLVFQRVLKLSHLEEGLIESKVLKYNCGSESLAVEVYSYSTFSDFFVYLDTGQPPSETCSKVYLSFKLLHTGEQLKQGLLDSYRKEILSVNPEIEANEMQIEVSKYESSIEFIQTLEILSEKLEASSKNVIVTEYSKFDCLSAESFLRLVNEVQ